MIMLQKSRSGPLLWAKQILVLPLFAVLLFVACEKVETQTEDRWTDTNTKTLNNSEFVITFNGKTISNPGITILTTNERIDPNEFKTMIKREGIAAYDKITFEIDGTSYKGAKLASIIYTEEKEELFMRKMEGNSSLLKIRTRSGTDGKKHRAIRLGKGQIWSVNYTGDEALPPPPPPPSPPSGPPLIGKVKYGTKKALTFRIPPVADDKELLERLINRFSIEIVELKKNDDKESKEDIKKYKNEIKLLKAKLEKIK